MNSVRSLGQFGITGRGCILGIRALLMAQANSLVRYGGPLICTWQYLYVLLYKLLDLIKKVEAPVVLPDPVPEEAP